MSSINVKPSLLRWARKRADRDDYIEENFPKIESWERGEKTPSFTELERFAKATYTPIGYLLLDKPSNVQLPISDFRTIKSANVNNPSLNLLDTVYLCQQRQEWYREEVKSLGEAELDFVGSMNTNQSVESSARKIRGMLNLDNISQQRKGTKDQLRRRLIDALESLGVLVMVSGIVGNNTHRGLNVKEFRGFALTDPWAPLVFVNGKDSKWAQIFTLAHEAAHIWLGQSAVSGNTIRDVPDHVTEKWCNAVAAEMLVPSKVIRQEYDQSTNKTDEINRLAGRFKVSKQVIIRRIYDIGGFDKTTFQKEYDKEAKLAAQYMLEKKKKGKTEGNYYNNVLAHAGKRFTRTLIVSTAEGRTMPIMLRRLLDVWNTSAIEKISEKTTGGQ